MVGSTRTLPEFTKRLAERIGWRPRRVGGVKPDDFQQWAYARSGMPERGQRDRQARVAAAALLARAAVDMERVCALSDKQTLLESHLGEVLERVACLCCECGVDMDDVMARRMASSVERLR